MRGQIWKITVTESRAIAPWATYYGVADNHTDACKKAHILARKDGLKKPHVTASRLVAERDF